MSVSDSVSGERTSVRGVRVLQDFITHYDGIDGTTPTMLRFRAGERGIVRGCVNAEGGVSS